MFGLILLIQFYRGWKSGDKEIWKDIQRMERIQTDFAINKRVAVEWFKRHRQKEKKSKSSKSKRSKTKPEVKKEASPSKPSRKFIRLDYGRSFVRLRLTKTGYNMVHIIWMVSHKL